MRTSKSVSREVRVWGYVILVVGTVIAAQVVLEQLWFSNAPDLTVLVAGTSMILTGLVSISIAKALRNLEARLDKPNDGENK